MSHAPLQSILQIEKGITRNSRRDMRSDQYLIYVCGKYIKNIQFSLCVSVYIYMYECTAFSAPEIVEINHKYEKQHLIFWKRNNYSYAAIEEEKIA